MLSVDHSSAGPHAEIPIDDPKDVIGSGYGESKWVTEQVLLRATHQTGVRVNVIRVGQLCGNSAHGGWNEKEWVPAMVKWSQMLGAVPDRDGVSLLTCLR